MAGNAAPPPPPPPSSTPPGWYDDPGGSAGRKRYWDGQSWTDHFHSQDQPYQQQRQPTQSYIPPARDEDEKPWYKRPWPLIGLAFLLLIIISAIAGGSSTTEDSGSGAKSDDTETVGINQPITVKGTQYRALSARTAASVGDSFSKETADGVFVIVEIELTNLKDDTRTISGDAIKLVTTDGKSYDTDSDALLSVDDQIFLEEIQPNLPKKGTLVYDVPANAVSGAQLRVEDLFSSAHGLINLGL